MQASGHERSLASVPRWLLGLLALALVAQFGWTMALRSESRASSDLPHRHPPRRCGSPAWEKTRLSHASR
jgi:hypothetical protein